MSAKATQAEGYQLLHRGAIALAEVESNGMRIDVEYLDKAIEDTAAKVRALRVELQGMPEYALQRRRYGQRANLTSRDQLAVVLYDDQGHECTTTTDAGKRALDEPALERIGSDYTLKFLELEKLNKLYGTYLTSIRAEVNSAGFLHANFGLHAVRSFRGQSDSPNLQNVPIRHPVQGKIIRQAFIPREGHAIIEMDYSSLEVMVACALSGDPKLQYDATQGDMHRDMAAECYLLEKENVSKDIRQNTKGGFVFAEFYGDWYKQVTKNLWDGIERYHLKTAEGVPLYDHLAAQGITGRGACDADHKTEAGTFEAHIERVENRFWNERFRVYHDWRKARVAEYKRHGKIQLQTGFFCHGPMSKNQVMNYHIQGPAFHCLLWSLTTLVRELKQQRMGAKIIGQIHDSIIADVPLPEVNRYLKLAQEITTTRLREHWDWITVPFEVEAEIAYTNWYEKKEIAIPT